MNLDLHVDYNREKKAAVGANGQCSDVLMFKLHMIIGVMTAILWGQGGKMFDVLMVSLSPQKRGGQAGWMCQQRLQDEGHMINTDS